MKKDYYEVLGIDKSADADAIKKSYRQLASKYHPDKVTDALQKSLMEEKFKEVKEAYETLSDPDKRSQYDRFGHDAQKHSYASRDFDFDDFNEIFGDLFSRHGFNSHSFRKKEQVINVSVSLTDAYIGRTLSLKGVTIKIPKGIKSGTRLFVDGKIYKVDIQPHHKFKRSDNDLLVETTVSAIEAITGINAIIEHLDSAHLQFSVPAGIQPGQVIKLTGKGMKDTETDRVGDLLIKVNVTIPRNISNEQKKSLESFSCRTSIII